jgi:multidrug efflux pump subunit AcrA (membrane-fusion protein)
LIALVLLLAVGGTGVAGWYFYARRNAARPDLILHTVKKEKLQITITERGSLEPSDNTFFSCKVKSKTPGGAATSIRWVIDNGSIVKEGDKILELDDSALQDSLTTQEIEVYKAKQAWIQADLNRTINKATNETDVSTKITTLKVAEISLKEYLEGLYVQSRLDLQNKYDMSKSDLFMWQERAVWSERMSRPGRQFVTVSQAEADESRHKTAELTRANYLKQLEVLDTLTKEKNRVSLQGAIDDAKHNVDTAKEKLRKTLELDDANVESTYAQYQKQLSKMNDIVQEIDVSLIRAPRDGMVVYYVEERARFGQSSGGVIAQGEQVKEGQKLLAVPDLKQMLVNARVHEAMVPLVKDDIVKSTGFSEAINTSLLFTTQPINGLCAYLTFDADLQSAFRSKHAEVEKRQERRGLSATVRVNAFPNRPLRAHVKSVAPVASVTDFFSSDVKVYQTYIAIDDDRLQGLKPGMDAVITIFVDSTEEPVVTVPLQALLGNVEMGEKRRCFVMVDDHPEMREISLGKANETIAEVKEGLNDGEVVVLNPSMLLSDKEKVAYGVQAPSDQGGRNGGSGQGGGKGKGNWQGKGKGGGMPGMKGGGMPGGGEMPGGMQGGGGRRGGMGGGMGGGGPRSQGGAPSGGKMSANP